ncbi:hypothetical protein ACF09H_21760 [Streptomyces sp. NPDC014983]|uniref:hypothetical protein n=1 Tax=Streptomyces sp. NPDC014983 TaxID=3364933 RepID=UPI0037032902
MTPHGISVFDLFPDCEGPDPRPFAVGADFEVVTLPEDDVRSVLEALARREPHPVGAAIATDGWWSLLVPPGSHLEAWPGRARYQNSGSLIVPPVTGAQNGSPRWARLGNAAGHALTAPLLLSLALTAITAHEQNDSGPAAMPLGIPTPELV